MGSAPDGVPPWDYDALPGNDQQRHTPQQQQGKQQQQEQEQEQQEQQHQCQGSAEEERISIPGSASPAHSAPRAVRDVFFLLLLPLLVAAALYVFASGVFPFLPPRPLQNLRLLLLMLLQGVTLLPAILLAFLVAWAVSLLLLYCLKSSASPTWVRTGTFLFLLAILFFGVSFSPLGYLYQAEAEAEAEAEAKPGTLFDTTSGDLCTPPWAPLGPSRPWDLPRLGDRAVPPSVGRPAWLPLLTPATVLPLPPLLGFPLPLPLPLSLPLRRPLPLPLPLSRMLPPSGAPKVAAVRRAPPLPSAANSSSSTSLGASGGVKWEGRGLSGHSSGAGAAATAEAAPEALALPVAVSYGITFIIFLCAIIFVLSPRADRVACMDKAGIFLKEVGELLLSPASSIPLLLLLFTSAASYVLSTILTFFYCSLFVTWDPKHLPTPPRSVLQVLMLLKGLPPHALPLLHLTGPGSVSEGEGGGDLEVSLQAILLAVAAVVALLWLLLLSFYLVSFVAFFLLCRVKSTPSALLTRRFCLSSLAQALRHAFWESGGTVCLASLVYLLLCAAVSLPVLVAGIAGWHEGDALRGAVLGMLDVISGILSYLLSFFIFSLVLPCAAIFGDSFWGASARAWALVRGNVVEMVCVDLATEAVWLIAYIVSFYVTSPVTVIGLAMTLASSPRIGGSAFLLSKDAGVACFMFVLQGCVWALYIMSKPLPAPRGVAFQ